MQRFISYSVSVLGGHGKMVGVGVVGARSAVNCWDGGRQDMRRFSRVTGVESLWPTRLFSAGGAMLQKDIISVKPKYRMESPVLKPSRFILKGCRFCPGDLEYDWRDKQYVCIQCGNSPLT